MIISASFSKPTKLCEEKFSKKYLRAKAKLNSSQSSKEYSIEFFTETQTFHAHFSSEELDTFIEENAGITFKNCLIKTESKEITILSNKKGKITRLEKTLLQNQTEPSILSSNNKNSALKNIMNCEKSKLLKNGQKTKNYLIMEGTPVPFLVHLGVMTDSGKIISSRYDKFRQINRFLEFIDDIFPSLEKSLFTDKKQTRSLKICDFGCGKSYLTFAVHYYFTQIKKINVEITGLDLKKDVIEFCNKTARILNCDGLKFSYGNISDYNQSEAPDLVITLHACDTATDFALDYAIKKNAKAILSVPCCQHEINAQLDENLKEWKKTSLIPEEFSELLKFGLIKEKFSALLTDALRAKYLENSGYQVQVLEFTDDSTTPKNILIRAVKKNEKTQIIQKSESKNSIENRLNIFPTLKKLLE